MRDNSKYRYAWLIATLLIAVCGGAQTNPSSAADPMETVKHLTNFQVVELRRYSVKEGEQKHFATYFEAYFPEAMQQLGAIVAGEFIQRDKPVFTWIREFHTMDDRAKANAELYYGPVWKEHRTLMNSMITDSDNVLLLRPLSPEKGVPVYPTVDPVKEPDGAQGVLVAQIFQVKANRVEEFARKMEATFDRYRELGVREAGVLVTLDANNNFPQLPIRTDGPYVVWLGIMKSHDMEAGFHAVANGVAKDPSTQEFLRSAPELVTLDPAPRSRLRWFPPDGTNASGN